MSSGVGGERKGKWIERKKLDWERLPTRNRGCEQVWLAPYLSQSSKGFRHNNRNGNTHTFI